MPTSIDRHELERLVREDRAVLAEVLPRPEYEWAHLPGAIHLPLEGLDPGGLTAVVGADRPVIVYCHDLQ